MLGALMRRKRRVEMLQPSDRRANWANVCGPDLAITKALEKQLPEVALSLLSTAEHGRDRSKLGEGRFEPREVIMARAARTASKFIEGVQDGEMVAPPISSSMRKATPKPPSEAWGIDTDSSHPDGSASTKAVTERVTKPKAHSRDIGIRSSSTVMLAHGPAQSQMARHVDGVQGRPQRLAQGARRVPWLPWSSSHASAATGDHRRPTLGKATG